MKRKVNYKKRLHPDDSTSTFLMVKKSQQDEFNIILVYKPQGEKTLRGPKMYDDIDLKNNIFAFGFQAKVMMITVSSTPPHTLGVHSGPHSGRN